jgi:putative ABC transport system permease protein
MSWIRERARRLFGLDIHRADTKHSHADADAELDAVIEQRTEYLMARGLSRADAHAEAVRHLGPSVDEARELVHESAHHREERLMWRERLSELLADLKFSARSLLRAPALVAATVITLALAIGANTAIYSAVRAVILRPLPYREPDRLVAIWETNPEFKWTHAEAAPANIYDWRERVSAFADVGGYFSFGTQSTLTGQGEPKMVNTLNVMGNLFDVLGVRAEHGRTFKEEETWEGNARVVLLPHRTWRNQFISDTTIVGRTIVLDGREKVVVGVLPASFAIPGTDPDYYVTPAFSPANRTGASFRRAHYLRAVARLKPGVSIEGANAGFQPVVKALQTEFPGTNRVMGAELGPLHADLVGETKTPLMVMFAAVGLLLLIGCANVANLLVVRAAGREREAAVRLALGAGSGHLVRRALSESAVLAIAGGGLGLVLGWWGTQALVAMQPPGLLPVGDVGVSWNVLGFVLLATAGSAVLFGAAPAIWAAKRSPADVLKDEGRSSSRSKRARQVGNALLVGQVALALTLTLGAGLLVRSYAALQKVEYGFSGGGVLTAKISIPRARYDSATKVVNFFEELQRRVAALPGVTSAALASKVPLGEQMWSSQFSAEGREIANPTEQIYHRAMLGDYAKVMGTRLVEGRFLDATDNLTSAPAVLVNEAFVKKFFRGESPIGVRITYSAQPDTSSVWRTVVGVVGDERQTQLAKDPEPEVFEPLAQELRRALVLVARTDGSAPLLAGPIRRVLNEIDPNLAFSQMQTMDDVRSAALAQSRFIMTLLIGFSCVGVVLAIVGVYGVVAQLARQRTREIGIRLALGAEKGSVQWLVVSHGLVLTAVGVAIGIGLTRWSARAIETLLYQVTAGDLLTYVAVPALVLLTAGVACWIPAARAARTDLTEVMRSD